MIRWAGPQCQVLQFVHPSIRSKSSSFNKDGVPWCKKSFIGGASAFCHEKKMEFIPSSLIQVLFEQVDSSAYFFLQTCQLVQVEKTSNYQSCKLIQCHRKEHFHPCHPSKQVDLFLQQTMAVPVS